MKTSAGRIGPTVPQALDDLLKSAISQRRLIRFWYDGKERIAEPHDYGIQKGKIRLLAYQIRGQSNTGTLPAWRWIEVPRILQPEILEQKFSGGRPAPSGKHHEWDEIFIRVEGRD